MNYNIIFIHGFLGTDKDWQPLITDLKKSNYNINAFSVSLFKNKNYLYSWQDFSRNFIKKMQLPLSDDYIIVGYSLGGRLAIKLKYDYPQLFRKVILIGSHIGLTTISEKQQRLIFDKNWAETLNNSTWEQFLLKWNSQNIFQGSESIQRKNSDYHIPALIHSLLEWSLAKQEVEWFRKIPEKDKLYLVGENDNVYKKYIKKWKLKNFELIPKAGHRVIRDNPLSTALCIREFIK